MKKGCNFGNEKCPHGKYELVEKDEGIRYVRCWYCFSLFQFTPEEYKKALVKE